RSWRRDDHYGRVPEAADLRKAVQGKLDERSKQLARCKAMLAKAGKPEAPGEFQKEPEEYRLRHSIWRGWEFKTGIRQGFMAEKAWFWALRDECRLAELEQREPADWAKPAGMSQIAAPIEAPKVETPAARRNREYLAEKAREFRAGHGGAFIACKTDG